MANSFLPVPDFAVGVVLAAVVPVAVRLAVAVPEAEVVIGVEAFTQETFEAV